MTASDKIVAFPGPVCNITNLRAGSSSKLRKDWTPPVVQCAMDKLANSEEENANIGEVITIDRTIAFVKRSPEFVTKEMLGKHTTATRNTCTQQPLARLPNLFSVLTVILLINMPIPYKFNSCKIYAIN